MRKVVTKAVSGAGLVGTVLLLGGCTGSGEDVRVSACQQLAVILASPKEQANWLAPEVRIEKLAEARVQVRTRSNSPVRIEAVCWYAHDDSDESLDSHLDPLSAFDTAPFRMTVNGDAVVPQELYRGMQTLHLEASARLMRQLSRDAGKY